MEEANIESHGSQYGIHSPSNCDRWRLSHLDRIASMYERSKNFPCVVIWSMGNEAGPGDVFRHCYNYIKERDKVRPVQYERNNWITDMGSRQYPSVEWVWSCARGDAQLPDNVLGKVGLKTRYPYHINEYAHNYNNNCGNLKDYQNAIESSDRIMGGALWDWADQSLWHRLSDGRIVGGWGGTWGEKPEEGQGIMDGIVTTDRRLEPGYYEAKHVFQSFSASLVKARNIGRAISLKNKNYFRDSSHCRIVYKVLSDGEIVDEGEWTHFTISPRGIEFVELPPSAKGDRQGMAVRVEFRLRKAEGFWPAGWVLASDQLELGDFVPPAKRSLGSGAEVVEDSESVIAVKSGDRVFSFSKSSGELVSLKQGSLFPEELLLSPMTLDVFRMPVGGETFYREGRMYFGRQKALEGLREMVPSLRSISRPVVSAGGELVLAVRTGYRGRCKEDFPRYGHEFMTEIKQLGALDKDAPGYEVETVWRFGADGKANMHSVFTQTGRKSEVSRVGWRLVLKESSSAVEYYARGPYDNYCDRKSASFIACWRSRTDKFGGEFGSSQDTGNREEARWVSLEDVGLKFSAVSAPFSFAISPYSPTELIRCPHFELLGSPAKTELGLYAKVRGLGSNNCGPPPLMKDRILAGETLKLELDWE
jgi:beta-galactosidase